MSIENQIRGYMLRGNKINQWKCIELFRFTRLSAVIHNLKQRGYDIESKFVVGESGKKYKDYWISKTTYLKKQKNENEKEKEKQIEMGIKVDKPYEYPD